MWQDILGPLLANQLLLVTVVSALITTALVRKTTWFAALGDVGRMLTSFVATFGVVTGLRLVGVEPAADVLAKLPELVAMLLEAVAAWAGGTVVFKVAKGQPPSE